MKHSKVLKIAIPMILSNITVPLSGLVDTAVLGHLSHPYYLAGVGVAVTIFNMIFWSMGFLRMATTGIAAQAFGRNDYDALYLTLFRGLLVAIGIGLLLIVFQGLLLSFSFWVIHATPLVTAQAKIFFSIVIWGAPAVLSNLVIIAVLISLQRARTVLLMTVVMNIVNIVLDFVLVFGVGMKTAGVGTASLTAYYTGTILGLILLRQELKRSPQFAASLKDVFQIEALKHFFTLNRDIFIRTICLVAVFTYFTREGAQYGSWILAANVLLMNFQSFFALASDGFANAAEALVGNAVGTKNQKTFSEAVIRCAQWAFIISIFFAIIYFIFGHAIIRLLTDIPHVRLVAYRYLPWMIIIPIVSVWGFFFDGVFVGATMAKDMRNTMILALITFVVFRVLFYRLDNNGLWLAFASFLSARGFFMLIVFMRKRMKFVC